MHVIVVNIYYIPYRLSGPVQQKDSLCYELYPPTDIQDKADFTEMYETVTKRAMAFDVDSTLSG